MQLHRLRHLLVQDSSWPEEIQWMRELGLPRPHIGLGFEGLSVETRARRPSALTLSCMQVWESDRTGTDRHGPSTVRK